MIFAICAITLVVGGNVIASQISTAPSEVEPLLAIGLSVAGIYTLIRLIEFILEPS